MEPLTQEELDMIREDAFRARMRGAQDGHSSAPSLVERLLEEHELMRQMLERAGLVDARHPAAGELGACTD